MSRYVQWCHVMCSDVLLCAVMSCYMQWCRVSSSKHAGGGAWWRGALSCDVCCLGIQFRMRVPWCSYLPLNLGMVVVGETVRCHLQHELQDGLRSSWPFWTPGRGGVTQPEGLETRTSKRQCQCSSFSLSYASFSVYLPLQVFASGFSLGLGFAPFS